MSYLIDTHILLWWLENSPKLKKSVKKILENSDNQIYVSSVSVWEIVIKKTLKKLEAPTNLIEMIHHHDFDELPVRFQHATALEKLALHHNDPFDRLLIAQCLSENLTFITEDAQIKKYKGLKIST
jgi:PIN domain nuclease of toxin-antitoxin system